MPAGLNWFPLAHSLTLLVMIAGNSAAAVWLPALCWITVPIAALAICCGLSVVHECAHRTYFTGRVANDVFGRFWALVILMNFSGYRQDHMRHHSFVGSARDTEPTITLQNRHELARALLLNPHILESWRSSLRAALMLAPASRSMRVDGRRLLGMQFFLIVLTVWDFQLLTLAFVLPFVLSTVLDNLVSLPEHVRFVDTEGEAITRSIGSPAPLAFLLYFVNRHVEHHATPWISALRLSEVHSTAMPSYWAFYRDLWKSLDSGRATNVPRHAC